MKKDYRCSPQRLAVYFEISRDKWKARSCKYQAEKRALQIQVRDLRRSVDYWKEKCSSLDREGSKKKPMTQVVNS